MSNYWHDRFIEEEKKIFELSEEEIKRQHEMYVKTISNINSDIEIWYNRIARNNEVSLAEAKQLLSKKELKEFKWKLEEYTKYAKENVLSQKWTKQLENASARVHIERLEALKIQARGQIEKLYNKQNKDLEKHIEDIYKIQYYNTAFEISKGMGTKSSLYKLNTDLIENIIKKPWAPDGKHFSDRIWQDKEKLLNTLNVELTQGFIRGDSLDTMTKRITQKVNVSKNNVKRLVHTESAAYSSRGTLDGYKNMGVEKYEILAAMDSRTSDICRSLDGKIFDIKDYEIGVTAPPFHVMCRTTTIPYIEDFDENDVDKDLDFNEWLEKNIEIEDEKVENSENEGIIKEKVKNKKETKRKTLDELSDEWYSSLTDEEQNGIFQYTSGNDIVLSSYKRGYYIPEFKEEVEDIEKSVNILDSAIEKFEFDRDVKAYRVVKKDFYRQFGITQNDFENRPLDFYIYDLDKDKERVIQNYKNILKDSIIDKGYVSTSIDLNEPFRLYEYEAHTLFEIDVKKGAKGAFVGKNSAIKGQEELLLARDTKLVIKDVDYKIVNYIDDYGEERSTNVFVVRAETVPVKKKKSISKIKKDIVEEKPKTLLNYDKYSENWYNEKVKGTLTRDDEVIVSKKINDIIKKSEYATRFKSENLELLIESGKFKNQFETGKSGATMSKKFRKEAPKQLFGTSEIKLKKSDYEKYGYLSNSDFLNDYKNNLGRGVESYGDVIIRFDKEKLKNRITFTFDNSLGNAVLGKLASSKIENPSIISMELQKIEHFSKIIKENKFNDVDSLVKKLNIRYMELQLHGEIKITDVKEICFTKNIPDVKQVNELKKLGIRLYKIEGDKIVEI